MRPSFKTKFAVGLIFSILTSLLLLGGGSYILMTDALEKAQQERLGDLARQQAVHLEQKFRDLGRLVQRVDTLDYHRTYRKASLASYFAGFRDDFSTLSYVNERGLEKVTVIDGEASEKLLDHGASPWFREAMRRPNEPVFSGPIRREDTAESFILVAEARGESSGYRFEGVIAGLVPIKRLTDDLFEQLRGSSGFVSLVDAGGNLLFTSYDGNQDGSIAGGKVPAPKGATGHMRGDFLGGDALTAWARIAPLDWSVMVSLPDEAFMAAPHRLRQGFGIVCLIAAGLCIALTLGMTGPLIRRLNQVVRHTRRLATGELNQPLEMHSGDEFQDLADAVNAMTVSVASARNSLSNLLHAIVDPLVVTDSNLRITRVNKAFEGFTEMTTEDLLGMPLPSLFSSPESLSSLEGFRHQLRNGMFRRHETSLSPPGGKELPVLFSCSLVAPDTPEQSGAIGIFSDLSQRKLSEKKIEFLAYHDSLTGLPNRTLLLNSLEQAIHRGHRDHIDRQEHLGIMFIDLDRFKNINDTLGHNIGDQLLQRVSGRLQRILRKSDIIGMPLKDPTLARLGGDEFVILLPALRHREDAGLVAQQIIAALIPPFSIDGQEIYAPASIGIALYPDDGTDLQILMKRADAAMYQAKADGKNSFRYFTQDITSHSRRYLRLEHNLRTAINNFEGFSIAYQPKYNIQCGGITGAEALLRWQDRELGNVSPEEFIPLAEETGLILPLGEWLLSQVCSQLCAWRRAGIPLLKVAVNISGLQLERPGLPELVKDCLTQAGLDPAFLELELTESMLMKGVEKNIEKMHRLKDLDLTLALDDFGTGYSSLSYLRRFPIDVLKIDRSFIMNIETDPNEIAIVRATIAMAQGLGMKVVGEGIETQGQLAALRSLGCDEIQGFLIGKPGAPEDLVSLLLGMDKCGDLAPSPAFIE